jgi:hypothetical protein
MRAFLLSTTFNCVVFAMVLSAAVAAPTAPSSDAPAPSAKLVLVSAHCGHGWHWVPAGYATHGKWRDAHCSRN